MSQLRWSLLILGVVFIAVLSWWEWRRPRQARALEAGLRPAPRVPADLPPARVPREAAPETEAHRPPREPPLELPEIHVHRGLVAGELPVLEMARDQEELPVLSTAQSVEAAAPAEQAAGVEAAEPPSPAVQAPPLPELPPIGPEEDIEPEEDDAVSAACELPRDRLPELPAAPAPLVDWPSDPQRRVVALRLVATQSTRFAGRSLRQALAAEGFVLGKFAIFHKPDDEQRAVLSAASLTRPGTFDPQTMDSQHYGGLSLFAVVPGPRPLPETFEELVSTARNLNRRLQGVLQDEAGTPLTPARIASLREHLGRETPA
jgi:cell division protein ZipA